MRRAFLGGRRRGAVPGARRLKTVAEGAHFPAEPPGILHELEHGFILLGQVPLEVRDLLLENFNSFLQRSGSRQRP